jgi:hypothetical protein
MLLFCDLTLISQYTFLCSRLSVLVICVVLRVSDATRFTCLRLSKQLSGCQPVNKVEVLPVIFLVVARTRC